MSKGNKIRLLPGLLAAVFGLVLGTVQIASSFHHLAAHSHPEAATGPGMAPEPVAAARQADDRETDAFCLLCSTFNQSRLTPDERAIVLVTRPTRIVPFAPPRTVVSGTLFRSLHASRAPPAFV